MMRPVRAWMVPQELGVKPGMSVACDRCKEITWEPWDVPVPDWGVIATDCPNCGARIMGEVAPDWGEHRRFAYPAWLRDRIGFDDEDDLVV